MAPDDCCFRCDNPDCRRLTCYVAYCGNYNFYADPVRGLCGDCAREADGIKEYGE